MKKILFVIGSFLSLTTMAQVKMPAASPAQTLTQEFGLGKIEIVYSRPSLKGRPVFGAGSLLAPFGDVWRTGANGATKLTFSDPVTIGNKTIPAGSYGLFTIPGATEWTIIINTNSKGWGSFDYKEAEDVVADCFEKIFAMPTKNRQKKFIEEEINIKALLLVMVKNKSLDVIKTKNTRNRIVDGIKKFLPIEVFNGVKQNLTDDNFIALLSCLPEKEKHIITLSIEGFSNTEIGNQLNLSEKTIANLLSMARKKVKELWNMFME